MNRDQRGQGGFEDRLLAELQSLVERPDPRPRRWAPSWSRRRLALAGGTAVVRAVAAGAGVPFLTGGAAPAYAVSKNDDGTVTVEISSLSDAAGLQSKLREAGIRAVVQYLPPGKACKQPWFTVATREHGPDHEPAIRSGVEHTDAGHTRFTISKHHPTDETLVIMTQTAPGSSGSSATPGPESIAIAFAKGEVKPCEVVDAPSGSQPFPAPPAGAGQLHTEGPTPGQGTSTAKPGTGTVITK
jgi:hypothetical protein